MKVALCAIGRLENQYAREFVEHYIKLGFDKIYIYDNNYGNEEHFEEVLQDYIDSGLVKITDVRDRVLVHLETYNHCYKTYGKDYDWMAFFDFDEYLKLTQCDDIKKFLENFQDFDVVKVNWMTFTDNNLVVNDKRPLNERFTEPMEFNKCITYSFPENNHVKSIVKCGKNLNFCSTPHVPIGNGMKYCNPKGEETDSSPFQTYNFNNAYIKHFTTKTIDEWINNKLKRGFADRTYEAFKLSVDVDKFFKYNDRTQDKINFINKLKGVNIKLFITTYKDFTSFATQQSYSIDDNHPQTIKPYEIIDSRNIKPNLPLDDKFYSELYHMHYIYENFDKFIGDEIKYIGFCHYRKYFDFLKNVPDIDHIFKTYDSIIGKPIKFGKTIKQQYNQHHNGEDLEIIEEIIKDNFHEYDKEMQLFLKGKILIPFNMFILKKEDFIKYCEFIFPVLDEYLKIVGTDITKRINDNKDKYLKKTHPNNTIEYQYRIGGYLAERLTNVFMMKHFKKMKIFNIKVTEPKY